MKQDTFTMDLKTIRERARQHIEEGAKTPGYKAKVETVLKLLNEALATELVCVLRYKRHYFMATGINSDSVKQEFLQHAVEEQQHADHQQPDQAGHMALSHRLNERQMKTGPIVGKRAGFIDQPS